MNTLTLASVLVGCSLSISALSGCAGHQADAMRVHSVQELQGSSKLVLVAGDTRDEDGAGIWEVVLAELQLQALNAHEIDRRPAHTAMPQLVAGDWLAFECAIAGGYWDLGGEKGTPVFAEVPESWLIPE